MYIKLDREYEIKTTLGTIREIENTFGKSFFEVANSVTTMKTDDQIRLLFAGVRRANPSLTFEMFCTLIEEHLGIGDLVEYLETFFYALQYPGLSPEEVQQKIEKKLERSRELQKSRV